MKQARLLQRVTAFGWVLTRMALDQGCSYGVLVPRDMPRAGIGTATLWIKGEITGQNLTTGQPLDTRRAGTLSTQLGDLQAGRRVLTAQSDAEWWCLDRAVNGGEIPQVEAWLAREGEVIEGRLLVCDGIDQGLACVNYTAPMRCYIMRFDRSKE